MTNTEHKMFDDQYLVVGNFLNGTYEVIDWSGQEMADVIGHRQFVEGYRVDELVKRGFQVEFV